MKVNIKLINNVLQEFYEYRANTHNTIQHNITPYNQRPHKAHNLLCKKCLNSFIH